MKKNLFVLLAIIIACFVSPARADLLGLWQFEGDAADSSLNGNDGTFENGASLSGDTPTGAGQSLSLAGGTQHVLVPHHESLDATSAVTIAAWVKTIGNMGWDGVLAKSPSDGSAANHAGNYELRVDNGSRVLNFLYQQGGMDDTDTAKASGVVVGDSEWTHVAVTAEANGDLRYYLNGALAETHADPVSAGFGATNTNPLYIGTRADLFTTMDGFMDDVAVFDMVLSEAEIETISTGDFSAYIIPEPSTSVLGLVAMLMLLPRRRR